MNRYAYLVDGQLLHAIFELLTACEDSKEALPEPVARAFDDVQQGLQGGLRMIVVEGDTRHCDA